MKKTISLFAVIFLSYTFCPAQRLSELWQGLRTRQPDSLMPKGRAAFQTSVRKQKQHIPAKLIPTGNGTEWIISNGWELSGSTAIIENGQSLFDPRLNTASWYNATVPGTVLTTLLEQGIYPDPYFGLNNLNIPDTLCRMDWWYRVVFDYPQTLADNRVNLLFNGINYRAEVFLNGKKLGNINGAFVRGNFPVSDVIHKTGENVLLVHIFPPDNPGIPHEQSILAGQGLNGGQLSLDGPTFISSVGWDWIPGIRDRNTGIWQDVRLQTSNAVTIGDPLIITNLPLPDTTVADITISVPLKNNSGGTINGTLSVKFEEINIETPYDLNPYEEKQIRLDPVTFPALSVKKPKLWWPNGYGAQYLYNLELRVGVNSPEINLVSNIKNLHFGIREMSYELMANSAEKGNYRFEYSPADVNRNGKPIFNFDKRIRLEDKKFDIPTINSWVDESLFTVLSGDDPVGAYLVLKVNGVRIFCRGGNWGMDDGMKRVSRERLAPYLRLHKDAGFNIIRNWTGESTEEDFYALCDEYGMLVWNDFWITTDDTVDPNDHKLFMQNATDVVRRFRNHPSIALWCPRNEGLAPRGLSQMLMEMTAEEDPTLHYHGQSRYVNMGTSGPWGYFKDPSNYYTQNAQGFNTEMGSFAIPTANTIRKFIAPDDQWPVNDVWAYHDLHHTSQNFDDFMEAVSKYGMATNLNDFAKKAQMVCYNAWRNMLEAWNSKMWNTSTGLILWMSHPAWPSMIWQTYTYDYETPGSYFGVKKACEPLHIQMNLPDNNIVLVNTTRKTYDNLDVIVCYYDSNGSELYKKQGEFSAQANQTTACFIPEIGINLPDLYLVRLILKEKGKIISLNDYWNSIEKDGNYEQFNRLSVPTIKAVKKVQGKKLLLSVKNTSKVIAVAVKLNAINKPENDIILPAYFSDGYFNLLPGETRVIEAELPKGIQNYGIIAEGYNFTVIEI
ncbi:MAG: beta galactosidase jelly roll domain-containing protein [Prevotellaceae bacterium]|jgi:hypothetical protein|nr:beta galactosidase jelly roll domain-containing protein [Prevotellaceae bacterium]